MRFHEPQFYFLAAKAKESPKKAGYLFKKSGKKASPEFPGIRWQKRWCILYYNMIFYYETEQSTKPQGVILLEGSECHKVCSHDRKLYSFVAGMPGDEHRKFMFSTETEEDCDDWMGAVMESSLERCLFNNKELVSKVTQLESQVKKEKENKEKLQREVADQWTDIARLKMELSNMRAQSDRNKRISADSTGSVRNSVDSSSMSTSLPSSVVSEGEFSIKDIQQIIKVQSFIRGWIARTRWKRVAAKFLSSSTEGDKLKQRNRLIWQITTSERDYVEQLGIIVKIFQRPFSMASKSTNSFINEEEVESIFANIEVVFVLHQLFLSGIEERLTFWPVIHLEGFLSAMSSMSPVYHEYIRNHPYALQTLAQCKKRPKFITMLKWHEGKEIVNGQTLEQLLYLPVRTVPNYIRYLHDLIELTSDDLPERDVFEDVLNKLEEMQTALNDVLSDCESIRHTLEIERLIDGGCNVLLDTNQKFIRHGVLRQINSQFNVAGMKREKIRHCFLFSRHMIVTSRTTDGSLRLAKVCGKVPLRYTNLIEDIEDESIPIESRGLSFLLKVQTKTETFHVALMATKSTDKAAWTSDITQCMMAMEDPDELEAIEAPQDTKAADTSGIQEPSGNVLSPETPVVKAAQGFKTRSLKDDKRLIEDAVDIKYGEKVGPYNLPQIQYASVDRLIERLVDPRFPGTEYMDTFLLTYRIFSTAKVVLEAIIKFYDKMEEERLAAIAEQKRKEEEEKLEEERKNAINRERNESALSSSPHISPLEEISSAGLKSPFSADLIFSFTSIPDTNDDAPKRPTSLFRDDFAIPSGKARSSSVQYPRQCVNSDSALRRRTSPAVLLGRGSNYAMSCDYLPAIGRVEDEDGSVSFVDSNQTKLSSSPTVSDADSPDMSLTLKLERSSSDRARRGPSRIVSVERSVSDIGTRYSRNRPIPILGQVNYEDDESLAGSLDSESTLDANANDSTLGRDSVINFDAYSSEPSTLSRSNTSVGSGEFDDMEYSARRANMGKRSLELPGNPLLAAFRYDTTKRMSLPDASAPQGYQKNLVKWLGIDEQGKQGKEKSLRKGKNNDDKDSLSDFLADDSWKGRRESSFSDRFLSMSPRKSIIPGGKGSVLKNNKKNKTQNSPDSPRKKRGIFGSAFKTNKTGMKRSKSDFLRSSPQGGPFNEDEETVLNGRLSYGGDDDSTPGTPSECGSETTKEGELEQVDGKEQAGDVEKRPIIVDDSDQDSARKGSVLSVKTMAFSRAPLKIMNVIKHWLSKFPQDFDKNLELSQQLRDFFKDIKEKEETLPLVKDLVKSIERLLDVNRQTASFVNPIDEVLTRHLSGNPPRDATKEDSWTANNVAENLTLLEHHFYSKIPSQEFLKCAWTKKDKETKAPHILKVSKRFNQVTNLIAWRVVHGSTPEERATMIAFWINVAIHCRKINNYNSVVQINGGLANSAVYRMKKSWELVPKQLKEAFEEMQTLVSAVKSFKCLREALHQCNPPCVPYLGIYLSDLLFMDEGAKNFDENNLVNFAKMNRISRCIREIKQYQQLRYTLEVDSDVLHYLVATEVDYDEDKLYDVSLQVEPRE